MLNEKFIRVLYIDLDTERMRIEQREDLMAYLGGVGVASKLFLENIKPDLDILAPEQPIVFAIGAGAYVFPVLTKTVAMFISPLTGELGESYAGGRFAMAMLLAGYDALVITGKAKRYSYISLSNQSFNIRDARAMWGLKVKTSTQNIRERENLGGHAVDKRSILTIGPGGESGVAFASVTTDIYRHFGRLGLGACFGSKNLKAIMVFGNRSLPILNPKTYHKVYREIYDKCTGTDNMAKYHDVGTPINVLPLSKAGALPTLNLSTCTYEYAEDVSGEAFAHKNLVRKMACVGCPVGCIHIGMYRREFDKGHEYEAINVPYDYELIFALGSFIGIKTTDEIIAVIEETEALGLDAMSTGVCLGWATEALAKGFITKQDTIVDLQFGDSAAYKEAIRHLSSGANTFYQDLGKGSRFAGEKYGCADFAMQIAGNEMPGYHTGYGALVGTTVAARHSHLCNGGYSIDQGAGEFDEDVYVDKLYAEECDRCVANSLVMCLFARKIYDSQTIVQALNSIGWSLTEDDLVTIGKRIYQIKLQIKKELGFSPLDVKLPKRYFETPSMHGVLDEETTYRMIRKFCEKTDELMTESYA